MKSAPYRQHGFRGRFDWGDLGLQNLGPVVDALVVVDVLSFSTAVDVAITCGLIPYPYARPLYPDLEFSNQLETYARSVQAIPLGTVPGAPPASPSAFGGVSSGTRVVMATPNGGALSHGARTYAIPLYAGCLRNAGSLGRHLVNHYRTVGVIAAGERWSDGSLQPALEDVLGAGAILEAWDSRNLSPEAQSAAALYRSLRTEIPQLLKESQSGRELIARGHGDDLAIASILNVSDQVLRLTADGFFAIVV